MPAAERVDASGDLVSLEDQDRAQWDSGRIAEGRDLVVSALQTGPPGPYALQAAIAAVHDEAQHVNATDWGQIVALYDVLTTVAPSPVVQLNRAVAVAMRDGPEAGFSALESVETSALREYHLLPAVRADLLYKMGRVTEAESAYRAALDLVKNDRERSYLLRKLGQVQRSGPTRSD